MSLETLQYIFLSNDKGLTCGMIRKRKLQSVYELGWIKDARKVELVGLRKLQS